MEAWLESAVGHIKNRAWLKTLLIQELPKIKDLADTPADHEIVKQWAERIEAGWVEHGASELKQQRNLMTACRAAIKAIAPDHIALSYLNFTPEEWTEINNPIAEKTAQRNENQQFVSDPEAIAAKAVDLLNSREWSDIAAGLAVLTGRRVSEILKTAEFELKTEYSVIFTGALKRRGETVTLSFEIPTLAPANLIITALAKLRGSLDTSGLTTHDLNAKSPAVANACDRHFGDLVPTRTGDDSLYTHLFRTIYALIATYWYCPIQVSDLEFRAAIQGHYFLLDEQNPELRRNLATERHYYDYLISDGNGNVDGRKGIKLNREGVKVIETFVKTEAEATETALETPQHPKRTRPTIHGQDHDRLTALQQRTGEVKQADAMSKIFDLAELALAVCDRLGTDPALEAITPKIDLLLNLETQTPAPVADEPTPAPVADESTPAPVAVATSASADEAWRQIAALTSAVATLTQQLIEERSQSAKTQVRPIVRAIDPTTPTESTGPKVIRSTENAEGKVNRAIDQMIEFNSAEGRDNADKWAISISVLKKSTGVYQGVIERIYATRREEIDRHHQEQGISAFQNNSKARRGQNIEDVVRL